MRTATVLLLLAGSLLPEAGMANEPAFRREDARKALQKSIHFYRTRVGYHGAYLWRYAADLSAQEGEGSASKTSGWTQPPGTPSVGEACLTAWRLTGDEACLVAAVESAEALVKAQLVSGGWSSHFDLSRRTYNYRVDGVSTGGNLTTFDDNKTQSALTLLMHVDEALHFRNESIHECVTYALQHILKAQYPNGGWPQRFSEAPNASDWPVRAATYPESWPDTFPDQNYVSYYTLNDNNMSHIIDMLIEANRIYGNDEYATAAIRTAKFFVLAQMPDPQPGWAQQYDANMHPAWARKFEPPAVTGGEAQSVMRKLIDVYRFTGDLAFLEPIPRALKYYRSSQLSDGRLARFYELRTNRPLYFTRDYQLTHDDQDLPTHYSFRGHSRLDAIERAYQRALSASATDRWPKHRHTVPVRLTREIAAEAKAVWHALDSRGAWVQPGKMRHTNEPLDLIDMQTFNRNIVTLARFAGAVDQ